MAAEPPVRRGERRTALLQAGTALNRNQAQVFDMERVFYHIAENVLRLKKENLYNHFKIPHIFLLL